MTSGEIEGAPLRVLHVIHRLGLGGTEYGVIKVVNQLDRTRFAPFLCSIRDASPEARGLVRDDVDVSVLHRSEGFSPALFLQLADVIRDRRIDVIHSHNWTTYLYAVIAGKMAGVPVLIHGEHGRETADIPPDFRRRFIERMLARGVDHFTAVSRDLKEHIAAHWGIARSRIRFIPNGVELERYDGLPGPAAAREAIGLRATDRVVGSVGGFRRVKDYGSLVRAFASIRAHRPDTRLVLVGWDPGGRFQQQMEQDIPDWPSLSKDVFFLGVRTDIPSILAAYDVYVNCSVYEGMSNTILEAMSARLPVVATRVGGTPDIIEEGITGWMTPPSDPEALAERIAWYLDHAEEARAMGLAGRRRVEERHSFRRMVSGNEDVYTASYARKRAPWPAAHRARSAIARAARWSGALAIARNTAPPALTVLTYHKILPTSLGGGRPGEAMRMSAEIFEEQVERIAARTRPLEPREILEHYRTGRPFPRDAVWVTFDDGYLDNHRYAWPILKRYGVPATIFLVTDRIDQGGYLWWDDLTESVGRLRRSGERALEAITESIGREFGAPLAEALRAAATTPAGFVLGVDRAVSILNRLPEADRARIVASLRAAAAHDSTEPPRLMLNWNEVREMRDGGITFGGHTASHAFLDAVPESEAAAEIDRCLERIEAETGVRPLVFAYPRGRTDLVARRLLAARDVDLAVTTLPGKNTLRTDPLALHRRDAGYLALGPRFSPHVFDAELAGFFDRGRR